MIPTEIRLINKIMEGYAFHSLFDQDKHMYAKWAMEEIVLSKPKSDYLITINGLICKQQVVFVAFFADLYFLWYKYGEDL